MGRRSQPKGAAALPRAPPRRPIPARPACRRCAACSSASTRRSSTTALRSWHEAHGSGDSALAIDGKTIRGAIDAEGCQAHVLGIVGHDTKAPLGQKKVGMRPDADDGERNARTRSALSIPLLETLSALTDAEVRVTVLGHVQRGEMPDARDRLMASVFGVHAVDLIAKGDVRSYSGTAEPTGRRRWLVRASDPGGRTRQPTSLLTP